MSKQDQLAQFRKAALRALEIVELGPEPVMQDYASMQAWIMPAKPSFSNYVMQINAGNLVTEEDKKAIIDDVFDQQLFYSSDGNYNVMYSVASGFFAANKESQSATPPTGYKIHVSIDDSDPSNMAKGWQVTSTLAVKYGFESFKVFSDPTPPDKKGRQVAIYLRNEENVQGFIVELARTLSHVNVRPDPRGMPDDCQPIPGARFVSYRNDHFDFHHADGLSYLQGPSSDYLSQDHIECAKRILATEPSSVSIDQAIRQDGFVQTMSSASREKFISDVNAIVLAAKEQQLHSAINWHDFSGRRQLEDLSMDRHFNSKSPPTHQTAVYRGLSAELRETYRRKDLEIVDEPIAREALRDAEQTGRNRA
jgi:hypothetical protein